jgi:hypothetical protein
MDYNVLMKEKSKMVTPARAILVKIYTMLLPTIMVCTSCNLFKHNSGCDPKLYLSESEVFSLKHQLAKFDYEIDFVTYDSKLFPITSKIDSIYSLRKLTVDEVEKISLICYKPINDSIALYFFYERTPSIFDYNGIVGKVKHKYGDFEVIRFTSKKFSRSLENVIIRKGVKVFENELNHPSVGAGF